MKAMMLTGLRQMELREVPQPQITSPDDVLVRLGAVGVCGSDVHYYTTGRIGSQVVQFPFTVGHECAGTVVEVGPAVKHLQPGARVAIEPAMTCGQCDQCRAGRPNTCRKIRFLGCPGQASGCLSEYIVMPAACCLPIHASTTLEQGALSEPLAIGLYAVKQSNPMAGARIGILGMGPIGLSVLLPALAEGAAAVYCTDKIDARLALARQAGATWTGNPDRTDVVREIHEKEPLELDVVFECCGEQEAIDQAIAILKPGGKMMLIGIPTVAQIHFTPDQMRRKEICIQNVRRQSHCAQAALDMIEQRRIEIDVMATHRFTFAQTKEAFDLVTEYRDGVIKAMISFD